ncbi:putative restriction endonuclease domain-containing protein [Candidatus Magnetomoraceae bacterium gMMP-1]
MQVLQQAPLISPFQYIPVVKDEDSEIYPQEGMRVSEEEYWEKYYEYPGRCFEWNNGVLEERPVGDYLSFKMYRWFFILLDQYLKNLKNAEPVGLEMGFRLSIPSKTTIRKPDLAVVLNSNPVPIESEDRTYHGIFDICIEFLSDSTPNEVIRDTVIKKAEYCAVGVKEYYILDRLGGETIFYRLNQRGYYSEIQPINGVIRSEVLPGFQFHLDDLYNRPDFDEMVNNIIYKDFVLTEFQYAMEKATIEKQRADNQQKRAEAEKQRADNQEQRADSEKQRADSEKQRAEIAEKNIAVEQRKLKILAAKLRKMGIDPEIIRL